MGTASGEEASARRTLGDEVLQVVASAGLSGNMIYHRYVIRLQHCDTLINLITLTFRSITLDTHPRGPLYYGLFSAS